MKKYFVFICFMLFLHELYAQNLLDIYKKGTVKLVPDTEYAKNNQWDKVFETYYDTIYNRPMGNRKSIVMMPDGSLVVSHTYRDFYSLFDPTGKFVKEFGIKDKSGKNMKKIKPIKGIIGNHFFTEFDNMGKMVCFDFNGNYIKTLTLEYMVTDIIPMTNNKIAVVGSVIWSDRKRDLVAIIDYQTNAEKIIWDYFSDDNLLILDENEKLKTKTSTINKRITPPKIAFVNNNLLLAFPDNGEILFYDINGKLKSKQKVEWEQKFLSVEEQKEIRRKAMEKWNSEEKKYLLASGLSQKTIDNIAIESEKKTENITTSSPVPFFSNIIKDSDGNLLFFEMPETEGANKFNVWIYQDGGKFICQSSFVCDDYDLSITPSKIVFHNGYIYSLQVLKNATGNPLRLVRFKLSN